MRDFNDWASKRVRFRLWIGAWKVDPPEGVLPSPAKAFHFQLRSLFGCCDLILTPVEECNLEVHVKSG